MAVNGKTLLKLAPIKNMLTEKCKEHGVSYGLSEAGYDIRIAQEIRFEYSNGQKRIHINDRYSFTEGNFTIASAIEEFDMPPTLLGIVHDKSTWARKGLSVFNTVIEPGWKGFLTLELVHHKAETLIIPAGSGIAQVIFHQVTDEANYNGKYQNQENRPVEARKS
jgi:dCTP deaminase